MKGRKFIKSIPAISLSLLSLLTIYNCVSKKEESSVEEKKEKIQSQITPIAIGTWNFPDAINAAAEVLKNGGSALDAVVEGCKKEEANPKNQTVGIGGLPDRDGDVTLDACVMNEKGDYGAVVGVKNIKHVISLARKVMEETPHAILAGEGAEKFALTNGFVKEDLLTEDSKKAWEDWKIKSEYKPIINIENHDTIGMLALDAEGNISGACTTSGLAYKMAGRIGDSPIIGSGLYVDNEVGGAVATGLGEEVLKTVGSFLIVELMRQGKSPQEACEEAIKRIVSRPNSNYKDFQVCYIALNKKGEVGSYSIHEWFSYNMFKNGETKNIQSDFYLKTK